MCFKIVIITNVMMVYYYHIKPTESDTMFGVYRCT